jgi:hypothetical protein
MGTCGARGWISSGAPSRKVSPVAGGNSVARASYTGVRLRLTMTAMLTATATTT